MPSFRNAALAVAAALLATVQADYYVNPSSVSPADRKAWCQSELSTCPIICQQSPPYTTLVNTCDPDNLKYGCVCGDGLQPNVSEYSLTLPYFVCTEWGNQCVKACGMNNNQCANDCRANHPCGAQNPTRLNSTTASTMSATASSTGGAFTGLADGGSGGSGSGSANAAPAFELSRTVGLVGLLGGLAAGFAIML